ncbi:MAG: hypothetical protein OEW23_20250 [Candidatus Aminicenantes bacterium]|nr:hypothetical protein [Desulfobacteraceae bacterium]MDH3838586.1 hypothetical protein [Desulfobacteraceae bacterium]MDH4221096.1 hypothetical protein [Candidatus Aminicenantes bacterium]
MPEKCRVGICGFDPMLVKGYIALNMRAIWWHISDELYEEFDMKPGMKVSGKLLKLYDGKTGEEVASPNEAFEWETTKEVGLAVLVPPDVIKKYKLTAFMFGDIIVEKIDGKDVYPGEERMSKKWWPDEKMKLDFTLDYIG